MNNEIGRKITSLTLMTIMLAGGLTFAVPGMEPAYAANANLFVSAENSQFDNYFAGPMVIEVVVIDSDISDTSEGEGEPDVTVQGKDIRMAQATDGNWYGYFADSDAALAADATQTANSGLGLDFGSGCTATTGEAITGVSLTDTVGVFVRGVANASVAGSLEACTAGATSVAFSHVVRENKTLNNNSATSNGLGQLGLSNNVWPFIQLYDLNPTGSVVVTYNKGGGAQSTTLTFDTVDQFANLESDRTVFPTGANVHLTLTDVQLNIDPTDEDSWTWGTNSSNSTVFYQLFTENGAADADGGAGAVDLRTSIGTADFMFEDNGVLLIDVDAQNTGNEVLRIIDNGDSNTNGTSTVEASDVTTDGGSVVQNSTPITFTELSSNSGLFSNYDESDVSNLAIASDAARGVSASIDYNETPKTILVGFDFGSVDIQSVDDEWNSGEEIPVVLVDGDANLNSRVDEDLDLFNPDVPLIPALQTGNPFTLGEGGVGTSTVAKALFLNNTVVVNATAVTGAGFFGINASSTAATSILGAVSAANATVVVDKFSDRAILNANNTADFQAKSLVIDLGVTASELYDSIANTEGSGLTADRLLGYNLFNNDFRSINQTGTFSVFLLNNSGATVATNNIIATATSGATNLNGSATAVSIVNSTGAQSISLLNSTDTTLADVDQNIALGALFDIDEGDRIGLLINFDTAASSYNLTAGVNEAIVADFFTFGFLSSGEESGERIANQLIRIEVEETGDNTSTFQGTLEYIMLNQLNILDDETYTDLSPIADDPSFIVIEDLTDEDSPRVNYLDLGSDGVSTQVADQEEAPSHSGIVSFDSDSYKTADTVTITLEDLDLNTDSDLVDIYTTVSPTQPTTANDAVSDTVGEAGLITGLSFGDLGRLLDITFDDTPWKANNNPSAAVTTDCADTIDAAIDNGLAETGFTLIETSQDSGIFVGDFQIPSQFCRS